MIINTGQRTDIPAFYSRWFYNRIREGYVCVRNPYFETKVTRYRLNPDVVDLLCFCTKNPAPMLDRLQELSAYRQFWFVTITPYRRDIEPHVLEADAVIRSFQRLSEMVSPRCVGWRYDPILITDQYSVDFHIRAFRRMCGMLQGYTHQVVISFLDLYEKTKRNFPEAREVTQSERLEIGKAFSEIGASFHMKMRTCLEGEDLESFGYDCSGCMTKQVLEQAIGEEFCIPSSAAPQARPGCSCLIGNDIGAYNSCGHGCRYCYANQDMELVRARMKWHDPTSPFLIGGSMPEDEVHDAVQKRWVTGQMVLTLGGIS